MVQLILVECLEEMGRNKLVNEQFELMGDEIKVVEEECVSQKAYEI